MLGLGCKIFSVNYLSSGSLAVENCEAKINFSSFTLDSWFLHLKSQSQEEFSKFVLTCRYVFTYEIYFFFETAAYIHRKLSTDFINIIGLFSFYFSSVLKSRSHLGLMCEAKGLFFFNIPQPVFSPA